MLVSSFVVISVVLIGNIIFIGLFVGYLSRWLLGNNYKIILFSCFFIGVIILLVLDIIGCFFLVGIGIFIGLVVLIIGVFYFFWLMIKVD